MSNQIKQISAENLTFETLNELISRRNSFRVIDSKHDGITISIILNNIERSGMKCHLDAKCSAALSSNILPNILFGTPITTRLPPPKLIGWLSRILPFTHDYDIKMDKTSGEIIVKSKKMAPIRHEKEKCI